MRQNLTRLQSGPSISTSFSNPPYEYKYVKGSDISKAFHSLFLKHLFSHFAALYLPVANTFIHSFKFMVEGRYWCYLMSGFCTTNYHWFKNLEVGKVASSWVHSAGSQLWQVKRVAVWSSLFMLADFEAPPSTTFSKTVYWINSHALSPP